MSLTARFIKLAIRWTPKCLVIGVGNLVTKGIARMADYHFDLDARRIYVCTTLYGESEPIEIWLDDFALIQQDESLHFILRQARSNKLWLNNAMAHITGKTWKIPDLPQLRPYRGLMLELVGDRPKLLTH